LFRISKDFLKISWHLLKIQWAHGNPLEIHKTPYGGADRIPLRQTKQNLKKSFVFYAFSQASQLTTLRK